MNDIEFNRLLEINFQNGIADEFKNRLIQNCKMDEVDIRNTQIMLDRGYSGVPDSLKRMKISKKK